mmetsp:Transcript_21594/g.38791  ORF Transcript_21594/g.38791 Transcript_21594/m.38791 type:complete len:126 (+) Transcript_21594:168-545(+)
MLEIIQEYASTSTPDEQEDVFFARHLSQMGYKVAGLAEASQFSLEVPTEPLIDPKTGLFREPNGFELFGLHQTWLYMVGHAKERVALFDLIYRSLGTLSDQVGYRQTKEARVMEKKDLGSKSRLA